MWIFQKTTTKSPVGGWKKGTTGFLPTPYCAGEEGTAGSSREPAWRCFGGQDERCDIAVTGQRV